ncbi:MAG: hypothetical protein D6770_09600 [Anaerolineae bacterium]|nr:MAG: hypothetical protein D6770_09600 [Anaerolineae bacterium]
MVPSGMVTSLMNSALSHTCVAVGGAVGGMAGVLIGVATGGGVFVGSDGGNVGVLKDEEAVNCASTVWAAAVNIKSGAVVGAPAEGRLQATRKIKTSTGAVRSRPFIFFSSTFLEKYSKWH